MKGLSFLQISGNVNMSWKTWWGDRKSRDIKSSKPNKIGSSSFWNFYTYMKLQSFKKHHIAVFIDVDIFDSISCI